MKIIMHKKGMTRPAQEEQVEQFEQAGWSKVPPKEQAKEEVIRLKPAVKTKATATALEEANINKGDE